MHREFVSAFKGFRSDVMTGTYPSKQHDVSIDKRELDAFLDEIM